MTELIEVEWRIYASLNWVIIGSDNGLSPVRRQAIIWTNAGILLIGPLGTNVSEILIGIQTFSVKKWHLKTSAKWRLFRLGLNELNLNSDNNLQFYDDAEVEYKCIPSAIETETKWPPFSRRHFHMDFREWKYMNFD